MSTIVPVNNGDSGLSARTKINTNDSNLNTDKIETTDTRIPTQTENDALVGTSGTPSSTNKYVTDSDARNSNSRAPTSHAVTHTNGTDDIQNASEVNKGLAELATQAETDTGTDDIRSVTPLKLATTPRLPTQDENDAQQGTSGVPSNTNRYVTDGDVRSSPYINGLMQVLNTVTPLTKLDVQSGSCRDSTNVLTMTLSATLTINFATTGINALDTGVIALDTFYALFVIGDTTGVNTPKTLASLSATVPTLPSGYNVKRRIGWWRTRVLTAELMLIYQYGKYNVREYHYELVGINDTRVLTAGSAAAFTSVVCTSVVPSTSFVARANIEFLADVDTDVARIRVSSTAGVTIAVSIFRNDGTLITRQNSQINLTNTQTFEYMAVGLSTLTVRIISFIDEV